MLLTLLANLARMGVLMMEGENVVPQWSYGDGTGNIYNANVVVDTVVPPGNPPYVVSDLADFQAGALSQAYQVATTGQVSIPTQRVYEYTVSGGLTMYYSLILVRIY